MTCVFREVGAGGLDALMANLKTVEEADCKFKPWYYRIGELTRGLNAADAARILARYADTWNLRRSPFLREEPSEERQSCLMASPHHMNIDQLELEYGDVIAGVIMYLAGGSIAGRRRLKTGPSATFHRRQPYPLEGVMDVPSGTVSARPKSLHAGNATKWGELLRLTSGRLSRLP